MMDIQLYVLKHQCNKIRKGSTGFNRATEI